jgi:NAD(P)H-flavin reductase
MTLINQDPMLPTLYRIEHSNVENYNTFTINLKPANRDRDFSFAPGQFNMLYVFGVGEVPISISGSTENSSSLIHTIREVGYVTRAIRELQAGQTIGLRGPFGTCWPIKDSIGKDIVLVAGGIGLAPLRPVIYHILAHREDYNRVALLYGGKRPEDLLFIDELQTWRSRFDFEVEVTVDTANRSWRGNVGVVTTLVSKISFNPANAVAMICGPEVMMRFSAMQLNSQGLKEEDIFISMERNMKCAVGFCGHCQLGPTFICKDGPVFKYSEMANLMIEREI